jgi:hypothetical protein
MERRFNYQGLESVEVRLISYCGHGPLVMSDGNLKLPDQTRQVCL